MDRFLQGNTVLATAAGRHERFVDVALLEKHRVFVLWSFSPTPEACDGYSETVISVVPLKP